MAQRQRQGVGSSTEQRLVDAISANMQLRGLPTRSFWFTARITTEGNGDKTNTLVVNMSRDPANPENPENPENHANVAITMATSNIVPYATLRAWDANRTYYVSITWTEQHPLARALWEQQQWQVKADEQLAQARALWKQRQQQEQADAQLAQKIAQEDAQKEAQIQADIQMAHALSAQLNGGAVAHSGGAGARGRGNVSRSASATIEKRLEALRRSPL